MTSDFDRADSAHPLEHVLADYLDGALPDGESAQVSDHLAHCPACRAVVDSATDALRSVWAGAGAVAAVQATLPMSLLTALSEMRVADPAPGQVWRLRATVVPSAEELVQLAVVLRAGDDLLVAPVTTDPREATDLWTLQSPLGETSEPVAAWVSLQTPVGCEALDVLLGQIDTEALLAVHRAFRRGEQPPRGLPLGRPLDDELVVYRDQLRAAFVVLSDVRFDTELSPGNADVDDDSQVSLVEALTRDGWTVANLSLTADITPHQAREVLSGRRDLTPEQRQRVGIAHPAVTGVAPSPADREWASAVSRPEFRHRFERQADRRHLNGWQFRLTQAREPAAARGNRGSAVDWYELVDQRLRRLESEDVNVD